MQGLQPPRHFRSSSSRASKPCDYDADRVARKLPCPPGRHSGSACNRLPVVSRFRLRSRVRLFGQATREPRLPVLISPRLSRFRRISKERYLTHVFPTREGCEVFTGTLNAGVMRRLERVVAFPGLKVTGFLQPHQHFRFWPILCSISAIQGVIAPDQDRANEPDLSGTSQDLQFCGFRFRIRSYGRADKPPALSEPILRVGLVTLPIEGITPLKIWIMARNKYFFLSPGAILLCLAIFLNF